MTLSMPTAFNTLQGPVTATFGVPVQNSPRDFIHSLIHSTNTSSLFCYSRHCSPCWCTMVTQTHTHFLAMLSMPFHTACLAPRRHLHRSPFCLPGPPLLLCYHYSPLGEPETEMSSLIPPSHPLVQLTSVQFSSVTQSCPTLFHPMNRSMPGLPVHHQLPEFTQTHVH